MSKLLMIDVSSNNGPVNVAELHRAGYGAIGVKATEGLDYVNPLYRKTVDDAHTFGMHVVHYPFLVASSAGNRQAEHFVSTVKPHTHRSDRWAMDLEGQPRPYRQWAAGQARETYETVAQLLAADAPRFLGRKLERWVYGPPFFLKDHGIRPHHGEKLWLADYGDITPPIPPGWATWTALQFTDHATGVPGTNGPVDESHLRASFFATLVGAYPILRPGATGSYVVLLQKLLNAKTHAGLKIDGEFGPKTAAAVIALKRRMHWRPAPAVGSRVWLWLTR